ncbi:MAG: S41 family peptidase [Ferruginibacter sp.]
MEKKKLQVWLPLLFSIIMIVGIFIGYKMRDGMPGKSFFYIEKRRPIQEIMDLVENKYVDDVNINSLMDTAVEAMLAKLDPHSVFIPAEDLQQYNEDIQGSFYGIGIEFNIFDDTLNITNVLKDGPGYISGLKVGDKILKAGNSVIAGRKLPTDSIRKALRGDRGSKVTVTILRNTKQLNIEIERDVIPVTSVDAFYMVDSIVGYIRLNKFSTQTYREFMMSLTDLKKKGMQKLVLDLRGNGGGVLDEAVEIADEFLEGDKLITYTEGKHSPKKEYRCKRVGQFEKGELVVLTDEGTASASEILTGALQDWDRATIVGRRTFGKGLVQEQYDLSDNSALRLTIARYYTPVGRSIQRSYANGGKAYYEEISKRFEDGEMLSADSVKNDSTKVYKTHAGKKIYGGGGISPDYFVAADTSRFGFITAKAYTKGLVSDFGYKYFLSNQSLTEKYKTPMEFSRSFNINEADWEFFKQMALKDSLSFNDINEAEKNYLFKALKTSIARQIWRNEGYFEVTNTEDKTVIKAMEILHKVP